MDAGRVHQAFGPPDRNALGRAGDTHRSASQVDLSRWFWLFRHLLQLFFQGIPFLLQAAELVFKIAWLSQLRVRSLARTKRPDISHEIFDLVPLDPIAKRRHQRTLAFE